jgi:hypothetical protein
LNVGVAFSPSNKTNQRASLSHRGKWQLLAAESQDELQLWAIGGPKNANRS